MPDPTELPDLSDLAIKVPPPARRRTTARDLSEFAQGQGFSVTSTTGGRHSVGSAHYAGRAVDVRTRGKSEAEIAALASAADAQGLIARDERTRPPGQRVWGGPHYHLEAPAGGARPLPDLSDLAGGGTGGAPVPDSLPDLSDLAGAPAAGVAPSPYNLNTSAPELTPPVLPGTVAPSPYALDTPPPTLDAPSLPVAPASSAIAVPAPSSARRALTAPAAAAAVPAPPPLPRTATSAREVPDEEAAPPPPLPSPRTPATPTEVANHVPVAHAVKVDLTGAPASGLNRHITQKVLEGLGFSTPVAEEYLRRHPNTQFRSQYGGGAPLSDDEIRAGAQGNSYTTQTDQAFLADATAEMKGIERGLTSSVSAAPESAADKIRNFVNENAPGIANLNTEEGVKTTGAEEAVNRAINAATLGATSFHVDPSRYHNERERVAAEKAGQAGDFLAALLPFSAAHKVVALGMELPAISEGLNILRKSGQLGRIVAAAGVTAAPGAATFAGVEAAREAVKGIKGESGGVADAADNIARAGLVGGAFGVLAPLPPARRALAIAASTFGIDKLFGASHADAAKDAAFNAAFAALGGAGQVEGYRDLAGKYVRFVRGDRQTTAWADVDVDGTPRLLAAPPDAATRPVDVTLKYNERSGAWEPEASPVREPRALLRDAPAPREAERATEPTPPNSSAAPAETIVEKQARLDELKTFVQGKAARDAQGELTQAGQLAAFEAEKIAAEIRRAKTEGTTNDQRGVDNTGGVAADAGGVLPAGTVGDTRVEQGEAQTAPVAEEVHHSQLQPRADDGTFVPGKPELPADDTPATELPPSALEVATPSLPAVSDEERQQQLNDRVAEYQRVADDPLHTHYPGTFKVAKSTRALSPELRRVEARYAANLEHDPEGFIEAYNHLPDAEGGKVLNTDIARELSPEYSASPESRARYAAAVHEPASALVAEKWRRALADRSGSDIIVFTAGGGGSGKGTAVKNAPAAKLVEDGAAYVYDGTLSDFRASERRVEQALANGFKVAINYVHRPVDLAAVGAIRRAVRLGRTVPLDALAAAHYDAQRSIVALAKRYRDNPNVSVRVVDNSGDLPDVHEIGLDDLEAKWYSSVDETTQLARAAGEKYVRDEAAAGRPVPDYIQEGTFGGRVSAGVAENQRPAETSTPRSEAGLTAGDSSPPASSPSVADGASVGPHGKFSSLLRQTTPLDGNKLNLEPENLRPPFAGHPAVRRLLNLPEAPPYASTGEAGKVYQAAIHETLGNLAEAMGLPRSSHVDRNVYETWIKRHRAELPDDAVAAYAATVAQHDAHLQKHREFTLDAETVERLQDIINGNDTRQNAARIRAIAKGYGISSAIADKAINEARSIAAALRNTPASVIAADEAADEATAQVDAGTPQPDIGGDVEGAGSGDDGATEAVAPVFQVGALYHNRVTGEIEPLHFVDDVKVSLGTEIRPGRTDLTVPLDHFFDHWKMVAGSETGIDAQAVAAPDKPARKPRPSKRPVVEQPTSLFDLMESVPPAEVKADTSAPTVTLPPDTDTAAQTLAPAPRVDTLTPGTAELVNTLARKFADGEKLDNPALTRLADAAFGGTRGEGKYTPRDMYDAVETAVVKHLLTTAGDMMSVTTPGGAQNVLDALRAINDLEPRQTDRTQEQVELQQFSTPAPLAYVAARALNPNANDVVLEPSAGTGMLALWPKAVGARVHVNEIAERRRALLAEAGFDLQTNVDAELLDGLLSPDIRPTAIIMNPPFSATGGRVAVNKTKYGANHITQALSRLAPNGRLVAIVGEGMGLDKPAFREWWQKIANKYNVRANVSLNGKDYGKRGTTFDNQLLVIDKTGLTPGANYREQLDHVLWGRYENLASVLDALQPIINDRPEPQRALTTAAAGELADGLAGTDAPVGTGTGSTRGATTRGSNGARAGGRSGQRTGQAQLTGTQTSGEALSSGVPASEPASDLQSRPLRDGVAAAANDLAGGRRLTGGADRDGARQLIKVGDEIDYDGGAWKILKINPDNTVKMRSLDNEFTTQTSAPEMLEAAGFTTGKRNERGAPAASPVSAPAEIAESAPADEAPAYEPSIVGSEEEVAGASYVSYKPPKVARIFPDASRHPGLIVETASMAAVEPPDPTYTPNLPASSIIKRPGDAQGKITDVGLETIIYAGQRYEQILPDGETRAGYYTGDGPGTGKGRQIAGSIFDNWRQGRKRHVWVSIAANLKNDAKRDLDDVGAEHIPLALINDFNLGEDITLPEGVIFTTYSSLISKSAKTGAKRIDQLMKWLNGGEAIAKGEKGHLAEGMIIFDEAHKAKGALAGQMGQPTQTGQEVINLQANLPKARVMYSSATGATDVRNMAYMTRLGLWGAGTPFPGGFIQFMNEIESGGVGAMEMVSRDMKALGMYNSRRISYGRDPESGLSVEYEKVTHALTPEQRGIYDTSAQVWQKVLKGFDEAADITNGSSFAKSQASKAFWGQNQRFFRSLITAIKVPTAIAEAQRALDEGRSAVISMISTGEAATKRKVGEAVTAGADLEDIDFSPRQLLEDLIMNNFPVYEWQDATDPATGKTIKVLATDENGNPVVNREAMELRQSFLDKLNDINLPENPLDQIINHFGSDKAAELTGRKKRLMKNPRTGKMDLMSRAPKGVAMKDINKYEMSQFQDGKKRVAVITGAASTGISLHADKRAKNQQRRSHIILELSWSADAQIQANGRTHRTNQVMPPIYVPIDSDIGGEKRFSSTLAKRMESMGALQSGERKSTAASGFSDFNFEGKYGEAALQQLYGEALQDQIPGLDDARQALRDMGVLKEDASGRQYIKDEDLTHVTRFLNRVLSLELDRQNAMFSHFGRNFDAAVQLSKESGTFDEGVADIKGLSVEFKQPPAVVGTDPTTGAATTHYVLNVKEETNPVSFKEISGYDERMTRAGRAPGAFYRQKKSGHIIYAEMVTTKTDAATGAVVPIYKVTKPASDANNTMDGTELEGAYEPIDAADAKEWWTQKFDADPGYRIRETHVLGGALLPIWNALKVRGSERIKIGRAKLDDGTRVVGAVIPRANVGAVLRSIGVHRGYSDPAEIYKAITEQNETVELVDNHKLRQVSVHREPRLEFTGVTSMEMRELRAMGLIEERIEARNRFFVPLDAERGTEMLERIIKRFPLIGTADVVGAGAPANSQAGFINVGSMLIGKRESSMREIGTAIRRAGLLASVKTLVRNLSSNPGFAVSEEGARPFMALADIAMSKYTGNRTKSGIDFGSIVRSVAGKEGAIIKGSQDFWKAVWEGDPDMQRHYQITPMKSGLPILDAYVQLVGNINAAIDRPAKAYALRRELDSLAAAEARNEHAQDPSVNVRARTQELRRNPTEEMQREAITYAEIATFQNDNPISSFIRDMKAEAERMTGAKGNVAKAAKFAFEMKYPFDRTPTNIFLRILDHTPVGIGMAVHQYRRGIKTAAEALEQAKLDTKLKAAKENERRLKDYDRRVAKARREAEALNSKQHRNYLRETERAHKAAARAYEKSLYEYYEAVASAQFANSGLFEVRDPPTPPAPVEPEQVNKPRDVVPVSVPRPSLLDPEGLAEAVAGEVMSKEDQRRFAETVGRAALGNALGAIALTLLAKGLIDISGITNYDDETDKYFAKRRAGVRDGSIKIPGTNLRFNITGSPLGNAIVAIATGYEQSKRPTKSTLNRIKAGAQAAVEIGKQQPLLKGQLEDSGDDKRSYKERAAEFGASFMPRIGGEIAEILDPNARKSYGQGPAAQFKRNIPIPLPGNRQSLPVQPNTVGGAAERGNLTRRALRAIDPFEFTRQNALTPRSQKSLDDDEKQGGAGGGGARGSSIYVPPPKGRDGRRATR